MTGYQRIGPAARARQLRQLSFDDDVGDSATLEAVEQAAAAEEHGYRSTPYEAVAPMLRCLHDRGLLPAGVTWVDPCAGDGRLVDHVDTWCARHAPTCQPYMWSMIELRDAPELHAFVARDRRRMWAATHVNSADPAGLAQAARKGPHAQALIANPPWPHWLDKPFLEAWRYAWPHLQVVLVHSTALATLDGGRAAKMRAHPPHLELEIQGRPRYGNEKAGYPHGVRWWVWFLGQPLPTIYGQPATGKLWLEPFDPADETMPLPFPEST